MRERPDILILYHAPAPGGALESDLAVLDQVAAVAAALARAGARVRQAGVADLPGVADALAADSAPVIFNLVEGFACGTAAEAALAPAVARAAGRAVTGGDTAGLLLTLDKWRGKAVLAAAGLPVPEGCLVPPGGTWPLPVWALGKRAIVKPVALDASEGMDGPCVFAADDPALGTAIARLHAIGQAALVERYIEGREFNVALFETPAGALRILPPAEIVFDDFGPDRPRVLDYAAKWRPESFEYRHTRRVVPAPVAVEVRDALVAAARAAWAALGCRGYARVDLRMDAQGALSILEVNLNPDLSPDAGFAAALEAAGFDFDAFVIGQLEVALAARAGMPPAAVAGGGAAARAADAVSVRYSAPSDRDAILAFAAATGFFRDDEIEIAREVLDEALAKGPTGHYQSFTVLDAAGAPVGWICHGPTPCTLGTFDIYWIIVAPAWQGRRVGRRLLEESETRIRAAGGRISVIETSGRAQYDATRGFYLRLGYAEAARLRDFYAPGDDKVVYLKRLA